jgi:hypothetical protein
MADSNDKRYQHIAQQRVLLTLKILLAHSSEGITPSQISMTVKTSPSNTTRDLANLEIAGLAYQRYGRWFSLL